MSHTKTFEAINKLKDIELELHRLKNALEMANKAFDAQRTWVGLTNAEVNNFAAGCHLGKSVQGAIYEAEAKLKEKNHDPR